MSDDRGRKVYVKKSTGTVPKVRNKNASRPDANRNVLSNDLGLDLHRIDTNSRRNYAPPGYYTMNSTMSDEARPNEVNLMANGNPPSQSGSSISRRDSSGTIPKCDNVTKYPDKKQIEDKLTQIREYIRVTSSLMATMKNTDDQSGDEDDSENLAQVLKDLRDSEAKLVSMLGEAPENGTQEKKVLENDLDTASEPSTSGCFSNVSQKNDLEQRMEHANREIQMLHEQQNTLLSLKQKAENKLREARHIQEKLMTASKTQKPEQLPDKNLLENDPEACMRELEELQLQNCDLPENLYQQVSILQQKLNMLHNSKEGRNDLIQVLDKRDVQLQTEHVQLQEKLRELQTKKMQVDRLMSQLQTVDDEADDDDIGAQVRKICTMKEQLSKLKDMYELVKSSEMMFESQSANDSESEENAQALPVKTDNVIQNHVKGNLGTGHPERNTRNQINQRNQEKQINKNMRERLSVPTSVRNKSSSDSEKLRLQAELQAKRRELEEIMCKHKAGTSNLNHDVGNASNSLFEGVSTSWYPVIPNQHNRPPSSERYSSDECPEEVVNDYTEPSTPNHQSVYLRSGYRKHPEESDVRPVLSQSLDCERFRNLAVRTPERSIRSASVAVPRTRERSRSASKQEPRNKMQVQKQLELIRSVCDSMLEQQQGQQQGLPHVRNNLSPSPLYSEPRQFGSSPNPHPINTINCSEQQGWFGIQNGYGQQCSPADAPGYQNMLATNTLQTQAFMLNTLNQCCQMLWLQQRELAALRHTVSLLQERMDQSPQFAAAVAPPATHCSCPSNHNPNPNPNLNLPDPTSSPHCHRPLPTANNQKTNQQLQQQVSAACSMPNLNHGSPNIDYNNAARLLDSGLNNSVLHVGNHLHQQQQLWNGPALNNQVAPGNRANNYWDNFRRGAEFNESYSRQNLLSSKTNEALHNTASTSERPNNSVIEWPEVPDVKFNPTTSSEDTTARYSQSKTNATIPSDVLNINQIQKIGTDFSQFLLTDRNEGAASLANVGFGNEIESNNSNSSEEFENNEVERNRNEWRDEGSAEQLPRSKLFEELRENVYKEVASLISANECRPHFLIQLFRDLQFMSSDPLRCKTLQSLHSLITSSQQADHHVCQEENVQNDAEVGAQSSQTSKSSKCAPLRENVDGEFDREDCLRDAITFLEIHGDKILTGDLFESLKEVLMKKVHYVQTIAVALDELFQQHQGKKISKVRLEILKSICEILGPEKQEQQISNDIIIVASNAESTGEYLIGIGESETPQMQNDDLTEADQRQLETEPEEQEGAVGGIVMGFLEEASGGNAGQVDMDNAEDSTFDFPFIAESEFSELGLDQVPTRLTNHPRSRSNTPSKDRTNPSQSNSSEHF